MNLTGVCVRVLYIDSEPCVYGYCVLWDTRCFTGLLERHYFPPLLPHSLLFFLKTHNQTPDQPPHLFSPYFVTPRLLHLQHSSFMQISLFFPPSYLLRIIPFTVFIHFRFILHASLFLILLPRPLHSPLQHPAMQTQPVLRGSELLKPLLPFPLCTTGLQRKEGGNG